MTHPTARLDDAVHQRVRLGILAVLREVQRADFKTLGQILELSSGNLSRNLTMLEERGLLRIEKTFEGRRPRTWVYATDVGLRALTDELDTLRALLHQIDKSEIDPGPQGLHPSTA